METIVRNSQTIYTFYNLHQNTLFFLLVQNISSKQTKIHVIDLPWFKRIKRKKIKKSRTEDPQSFYSTILCWKNHIRQMLFCFHSWDPSWLDFGHLSREYTAHASCRTCLTFYTTSIFFSLLFLFLLLHISCIKEFHCDISIHAYNVIWSNSSPLLPSYSPHPLFIQF
jgi:hypothetical protein